jgi:hypothetical protein
MAGRRSAHRQQSSSPEAAASDRLMALQRPPGRSQLDEQFELRRKRRSMAAAAAARAGGALSLTAVLLGAPALALPAAASPVGDVTLSGAPVVSAVMGRSVTPDDTDR